jgi:hypothetical protein
VREYGIAKQLSNPVAALVSMPLQFNYDLDVGPSGVGVTWQRLFFSPGKPSARVPGQGVGPCCCQRRANRGSHF